jgi:methylthioribulose-1-phosphate dehydratase
MALVSRGSHHLKPGVANSFDQQAGNLASLVRSYYQRGWVPATSSNFSVRSEDNEDWIVISQSGKDKEYIASHDFMLVDLEGQCIQPKGAKPSAETLLHTSLYKNTEIGAVLHTHSLDSIMAAEVLRENGVISMQGLELLKAFSGIETHESTIDIPVFQNIQDMKELSERVLHSFSKSGWPVGYVIEGHGIYTWGKSLAEAKRHLEALEYLFNFHLRRKNHGGH